MKPTSTLLIATAIVTSMFLQRQADAQVPKKMSYQAVIRNSSDQLVTNQLVGIQVSILQGSNTGTPVFVERHYLTTNANGLVSIEIGGGTVVSGNFATIEWGNGTYFLKTETDPTGGSNYSITGTSQLLSVPYALHAKTTANGFSGNYEDLTGKPDFTKWDKDSTDNVTLTGDQTIAGNKTFTGIINLSNQTIINVANPINNADATNKAYVDQLSARIDLLEENVNKYGTMMDLEGNVYRTVKIGEQVWMAENLKSKIDKNSQSLVYYYPNNDTNTIEEYGLLYPGWPNSCPTSWHLPTDNEWKELEMFLGMDSVTIDSCGARGTLEADKLKINGVTGFNAIFPGSAHVQNAPPLYEGFGFKTSFWCSDMDFCNSSMVRLFRFISISSSKITRSGAFRYPPFVSIRCVKD